MEADAVKNEVQKQVVEGRQMMRKHQLQDDDRKQEQQGVLERFQHDGKWKQEQLWGEGNPQQQEHGGQKTY